MEDEKIINMIEKFKKLDIPEVLYPIDLENKLGEITDTVKEHMRKICEREA